MAMGQALRSALLLGLLLLLANEFVLTLAGADVGADVGGAKKAEVKIEKGRPGRSGRNHVRHFNGTSERVMLMKLVERTPEWTHDEVNAHNKEWKEALKMKVKGAKIKKLNEARYNIVHLPTDDDENDFMRNWLLDKDEVESLILVDGRAIMKNPEDGDTIEVEYELQPHPKDKKDRMVEERMMRKLKKEAQRRHFDDARKARKQRGEPEEHDEL